MSRQGRCGYQHIQELRIGDTLEYSAGNESHHLNAMVTVTKEPGSTGVMVHVDSIISQGELSTTKVDEVILAGANELFF